MYWPIRVEEGPVDGLKAYVGVVMDKFLREEQVKHAAKELAKVDLEGKFLDVSAHSC